jgi:hypothetical protein
MNIDPKPPAGQGPVGPAVLPFEPDSRAEVLSATHLFTVEVVTESATPWAAGGDGLEHRLLHLGMRLLAGLKGSLGVRLGEAFDLDVEQRRENALMTSDYHGFWSHEEPKQGARYLVIAQGTGDAPAALLQEPAIRALLDAALAADVEAARAAEAKLGHAPSDAARRKGARDLLDLARDQRSARRGLFGRYIWARVAPIYPGAEDTLLPAALAALQPKDATIELRDALIYGLYDAVLALGPTPERAVKLARPLLGLLLQPEAAPLLDRMLQVPIYNLVFRPGAAPLPVATVVPDPADRARMKAIADGFRSQRAHEIRDWLDHG